MNRGVLSLYKNLELPHCSNVLSADVKSVSEKCWVHTCSVCSFLVCSALHFPSLCALCNNEIKNYKNETLIHMVNVSCYIPTPLSAVLVIQHVGLILNTRRIIKALT
jgi:hypothetical protein